MRPQQCARDDLPFLGQHLLCVSLGLGLRRKRFGLSSRYDSLRTWPFNRNEPTIDPGASGHGASITRIHAISGDTSSTVVSLRRSNRLLKLDA